jgi:hypothetical protein
MRAVAAIRDIKAGEELFVNYGYSFSSGPTWFKEVVISHLRKDPEFFNNQPFVTNQKTLSQLEEELKMSGNQLEIPQISVETDNH